MTTTTTTSNRMGAGLALAAGVWLCLCLALGGVRAQENIQLQIPPSLIECYNTSYYMNRDNRLPSNIETLITLIEKVENSYGYTQDMRQLAVSLLHRFRQDGIQRAPNVIASPGVIPYSPIGFEFPKFRILLSRLIPGNAFNFPNSSLSSEERCSLHFMLSTSFDTRVRGDENQVCTQLSNYRTQRLHRSLRKDDNDDAAAGAADSNFMGDVELLEAVRESKQQRSRAAPAPRERERMRAYGRSNEHDAAWSDMNDYGYGYGNGGNGDNSISQCPVENGAMWTPWGTVAAGTLIAGIAAGLQPQNVQLRTLLALARRGPGGTSLPQMSTVNVDNRWAATLAGDLAEVALVQVPVSPTETASVGANGAWNSTVMPKWYFLSQRQNMEMTDAEIRGGLDGLIIAMNIAQWRTQASNMRLSQLLRMYYSVNGVLGTQIMACNRKQIFANMGVQDTMVAQTSAFAQVLDREMQLRVTLTPLTIAQFSQSAANALSAYIPQYLNDVSCSVSNAQPQDTSQLTTAMTNIYVFLDTSWQYKNVYQYVYYILQRLNINPYASTVTLLAAGDGTVMVNTTNYLSDVYEQWNVTTQALYTPGFSLPAILRTVQNLTQTYMNGQQTNSSVGGRSMVALLIPNTAMVSSGDSSYATNQLPIIYEQIPDLHFIYYTGGATNNYASFVRNPGQDIFQLNSGSTPAVSSGPVVMRIKKIPRRIINPRCGASWYTNSWGNDQMAQYVRPGQVNFYRMVPNYFFGSTSGRYVNIQAMNALQFTICSSRTAMLPTQNSTSTTSPSVGGTTSSSGDQNCVQVSGGTGFAYDLSGACKGYNTIGQCPPLYLSVQAPAPQNGNPQTVSCSDPACQTPDQAKYTVSVVNLGCFSGAAALVASFATIVLAAMLHQLLQ